MTEQALQPAKTRLTRGEKWSLGLFWSWNLIFLAFLLLGFVPELLPGLTQATQDGTLPAQFLAYSIILVAVPVVSVVLGLTVFRRHPRRLFTYGYAVEGPLMLLLFIRFFLIRDATPPVNVLSAIALLGIGSFVWNLIDRRPLDRPLAVRYLKVLGLTLYLLLALYASVWVAFYAVPMLAIALQAIVSFLRDFIQQISLFWRSLVDLVRLGSMVALYLLGLPLFFFTATLVVLMPVVVPIMAVRAWLGGVRSLPTLPARRWAAGLSAFTMILAVTLMVLASRQPQHRAFDLLAQPPQSDAEARQLIRNEQAIRRGLLNAYLAPVRYLGSVGEANHIAYLYAGAFKLEENDQVRWVQDLYEWVIRPVLYDPVEQVSSPQRWEDRPIQQEPARAAQLYQSFFDEPIHVAERDTVVRAVRSTWNAEMALAAWQAVDDREVYLTEQQVSISEHGDWAEVELYEVYLNQTWQEQEVVYYFSLPESAALTGLWLNDRPERYNRFEYVVAPRGAAQAVYRNEVFRQVDPALLEQIGPRQYRLRIFPVAPKRWQSTGAGDRGEWKNGPAMHMWMTYRVLAQDSAWPMPQMAQLRNVYWDRHTARQAAGLPITGDDWLPPSVPASTSINASAHQFSFPGGETILALPLADVTLPDLPLGLRLAVVIDRSRSMERWETELQAALAQLQDLETRGTVVDVFPTSTAYHVETESVTTVAQARAGEITYMGGQNPSELLAQYNQMSQGRDYDAVLVLTDASPYDLGSPTSDSRAPEAPFWMVHLNGAYPLGYDDGTLQAIQASGGGVTGSVDEALTRLSVALNPEALAAQLGLPAGASQVDVVDGYAWLAVSGAETAVDANAAANSDDFGSFASRRLILAEMQRNNGDLSTLETLDALHQIAVEHHIVTPYSSMIVLVNVRQRNLLERLEEMDDRFDREFEGVGETVPQSFSVTGVPEPEEWLLLALAAGLLGWYYRKSLRQRFGFDGQGGMRLG